MTITINGVEFTDQTPTVPGPYLWAQTQQSTPLTWWIDGNFDAEHDLHGGFWCRLAPAAAVEDAFREGYQRACPLPLTYIQLQNEWDYSNAKRGVEGGV